MPPSSQTQLGSEEERLMDEPPEHRAGEEWEMDWRERELFNRETSANLAMYNFLWLKEMPLKQRSGLGSSMNKDFKDRRVFSLAVKTQTAWVQLPVQLLTPASY